MDPSEERLREVLDTAGLDLWSLIHTAIAVAARDHPADLRRRREGIVQSLYSLAPCRNCDPSRADYANGHGLGSARTDNGDRSVAARVKGQVISSGGDPGYHHQEASPEMRAASPTPSPEPASPELELRHAEGGEEDEDRAEIALRDLISVKEYLEDPIQRADEESLICLLQSLADMDVTYEVLIQADIARHVNALKKHQSEEVRALSRQIVSKWKELVNARMKTTNSACDSSSPPVSVPTENGSPQKIPGKSHHQNSSGPQEVVRSPKRHNGVGASERNGSDFVHSRPGSSSRSEAPTRPNTNDRSSIPPVAAPPAKRKERDDSLADQARLDSARRRLQENYQEAQNAKKQRTVQVMSLNEIPKPKNAFIRRGGGSNTARNR